jgi:hypothetical protein
VVDDGGFVVIGATVVVGVAVVVGTDTHVGGPGVQLAEWGGSGHV